MKQGHLKKVLPNFLTQNFEQVWKGEQLPNNFVE